MTTGTVLVWVDAREAIVVDAVDDRPRVRRIASDVPAHHRSTGHVHHDPTTRHGGGGRAGEPNRLEHLERFIADVADEIPSDAALLILGPGTVREHLEARIRGADRRAGRTRSVRGEASARLTDRQLVDRRRTAEGHPARRRTIGERPPHKVPGGTP